MAGLMKKTYSIGLIPGDGTGPEVTREAVKVLEVASQKFGFKLDTLLFPAKIAMATCGKFGSFLLMSIKTSRSCSIGWSLP